MTGLENPSAFGEAVGDPQSDDLGQIALIADSEFNRVTASFRNPSVEKKYRRHLASSDLPRQRLIWLVMTLVYALYGVLDMLTIKEQLAAALTMRWLIITPLAVTLCALTFIERIKPYTGNIFAVCVFLSAISVTWMIAIMPPEGSPPYIVGILIIFIFASCNVQMPFTWAASAFLMTTAVYSAVMLSDRGYSRVDVISGHFFMISSAVAAIATNYVQEMRLRTIWLNNERRKSDAARIERLMIEATAADKSKLNFLSILTHELRTPLHQVIGMTEIARSQLEHSEMKGTAQNLTQVIESAHSLLKKLGQMLRYADATAGRLSFEYDDVDVRDLIEAVFDQFTAKASAKTVALDVAEIENAVLTADAHHTSYALANIVDNAINACSRGERVTLRGAHTQDGQYAITIEDDGVGISQEKARSIFSPFVQSEEALVRTREGVGLGLTLAQKLLSAQGAWIEIAPRPGKGTIARVIFSKLKYPALADGAAA